MVSALALGIKKDMSPDVPYVRVFRLAKCTETLLPAPYKRLVALSLSLSLSFSLSLSLSLSLVLSRSLSLPLSLSPSLSLSLSLSLSFFLALSVSMSVWQPGRSSVTENVKPRGRRICVVDGGSRGQSFTPGRRGRRKSSRRWSRVAVRPGRRLPVEMMLKSVPCPRGHVRAALIASVGTWRAWRVGGRRRLK